MACKQTGERQDQGRERPKEETRGGTPPAAYGSVAQEAATGERVLDQTFKESGYLVLRLRRRDS